MSTQAYKVAEIGISYSADCESKLFIKDAKHASSVLREMWDPELLKIQEQFSVLYLNSQNRVNGFRCLSTGTCDEAVVDIKLLLGIACKSLSSKIIIAHNHPSGVKEISKCDLMLTRRIRKACSSLGIELLDHIILTPKDYVSFFELKKI